MMGLTSVWEVCANTAAKPTHKMVAKQEYRARKQVQGEGVEAIVIVLEPLQLVKYFWRTKEFKMAAVTELPAVFGLASERASES